MKVDGVETGRCGLGLALLVGVHKDDVEADAAKLAKKLANVRLFNDSEGKINLSLLDLEGAGSVLAVSNFTVYGDTQKNRRPSFMESAPSEWGRELFDLFVKELRSCGLHVETGTFGAHMEVALVNDGPVTVIVDTA